MHIRKNHPQQIMLLMIIGLLVILCSCSDPCQEAVCLNGSVCVDGTCLCQEGYAGERCDQWIGTGSEAAEDTLPSHRCDAETITYNDYEYALIEIEGRCWFQEDLRTEHFSNGDPILRDPFISNWCWDNDEPDLTPRYLESYRNTSYEEEFGHIYNGYAVVDERNICPNGWHVATDVEWMEVEMSIGMPEEEALLRGSNRGFGLRPILVDENWGGTNDIGLSLNPTGVISGCAYYNIEEPEEEPAWLVYWTSSHYQTNSLYTRNFSNYVHDNIVKGTQSLNDGVNVRCVKD
ncbi:MAG: FISUMP domain-containing protein [Bacteroidetes bacterium]|nr:FISUMP domain-containing protein [Bacteroidota bacterium]MDA1335401.1 FISUMP domain-containing protein [Bacteroidota bacterium]